MTSKDYVKSLDLASAIAAATLEIDVNKKNREAYFARGIARCFTANKEEKYKDAIEDLSNAIYLGADKNKALYYRAFAFYLNGNYEKAIRDCIKTNSPCKYELLGKIYTAMSKYEKAVNYFDKAIRCSVNSGNSAIPPSLIHDYREACRKMNSQG